MALAMPGRVDPDNGAPTPFLRIDGVNLPSLTSGGKLTVGAYVSSATASGGLAAVQIIPVDLTNAEMATLTQPIMNALYQILMARPEYAGSHVVAG